MTAQEINILRRLIGERAGVIHCITNPISINQCANTVLAVNARPIMAEHPSEVGEITAASQALLLNLGSITDARIKAMTISAAVAARNNIPFIVDAVGISCSALRRELVYRLISESRPGIIKGNYSEIYALYNNAYHSAGVDAQEALTAEAIITAAGALARKYGTVILASGKTDIITDGRRYIYLKNGTPRLASITGTGCMLGALCACFLSVGSALSSAAAACAVLGICGELADKAQGSGSFLVSLLDSLSLITDGQIEEKLKSEEIEIEEF